MSETLIAYMRLAALLANSLYEPTDRYEVRTLEGWTVRVQARLLQDEPELAGPTLALLGRQLAEIARAVPEPALGKLRQVTIWVEAREPHHPCMAYHPDVGWLRAHGMNPDKARCVELANAANFLTWTREQPWMVLHELAHAYHDRFLPDGFDHSGLRDAWKAARASGGYDEVLHVRGRNQRAYALTNPMEYFAEATEAYFGTNDMYPFVAAELRRHDSRLFDLLGALWGARP